VGSGGTLAAKRLRVLFGPAVGEQSVEFALWPVAHSRPAVVCVDVARVSGYVEWAIRLTQQLALDPTLPLARTTKSQSADKAPR
jgi:hypothetical protein